MNKANITPEMVRAALQYVPANVPRDEWTVVEMTIKTEFSDATGFDVGYLEKCKDA